MGNGEGPSYAMPTGASDYKEAVALGALGVVTGVLTGFAAVPTGPKKVMELVSNVLLDDTVFKSSNDVAFPIVTNKTPSEVNFGS